MTELFGRIMAQVLSALALSTKEMKDGRISGWIRLGPSFLADYGTEKFLKKLIGKGDVEDALRQLDSLTNENLLVAARTLGVIVRVDDNVTTTKEDIQSVDGNVKATKEPTHHEDQSVMAGKGVIRDIGGDVKPTKQLTHHVDQSRIATRMKEVTDDVSVDLKATTVRAMSVLVDGYISHCFNPSQAERYFSCLLKSNTVHPYPASTSLEVEGISFFVSSVPTHIALQFPGQSRWVLDRGLVNNGTVVPQTVWAPHTITDKRHHVEEAELQLPIFFQCTDGRLGLTLEAAAAGRCHGLVSAQDFAPLGLKSTTHIRIVVGDGFVV